ncbi:hypothetical protein [Hymenobacter terrestris]|uniref:Uncharacterized protein n=1 Tax=Hymenobacter terrestris TaxID=2748310 RepID=A0ABX2Q2W3_9BACT|nr:hypothetical protein [Hymenobacter terrestris]NVO85297.1 hypothetical protein [Hymenobacter terrestris]
MRPTTSHASQLWQFVWQVLLPAVPRLAWLVLGLVGFFLLNLGFEDELWPHHPRAKQLLIPLLVLSLGALPWLGGHVARQVRRNVQRWWWRRLWQLATIGAYTVAVFSSIMIFSLLLVELISWVR